MNLDDAACCDVKKDGSFTCYYKDKEAEAVDYAKLESQEYCLYLTDGKDMIPFSEGCETPNKHALWLSQTSFDVVPYKSLSVDNGYEGFKVLANPSKTRLDPNIDIGTNIIGIRQTDESLRVTGNFADSYRELTTNASELAFSFPSSPLWGEGQGEGGTHTFAMRRIVEPVFGVNEVCQQEGGFNLICEPLEFTKGDEQLEKYLKIKTTRDGQIWFSGRNKKQNETKAYVYNLKDGVLEDSYIPITVDDKLDNNPITVSEILNFDVHDGFAIAALRDGKGTVKIRVGYKDAAKRYGLMDLGDINSIVDLKIYNVNKTIDAKFKPVFSQTTLILDKNSEKIYQLFTAEINKELTLKGSITVGNNPTEMALNSESNKVFVINSGDATVTVVPLLNDAAEVLTVEQMEAEKKTFNLKDLFAGKSIPFKPEQIVYDDLGTTDDKDDRLIIGDKGLRSAVVLPTNYAINGMPKKLTPPPAFPSPLVGEGQGEGLDLIKKVDFQKLFP